MKIQDVILDYLEEKSVFYQNKQEYEKVQKGISLYLKNNGIREDEERPYFVHFVSRQLKHIDDADLKDYFLQYETIFQINHLVISCRSNMTEENKTKLRGHITSLMQTSIGCKYVPMDEIRMILGDRE